METPSLPTPLNRRSAVVPLAMGLAALTGWTRLAQAQTQAKTPLVTYKDANCGCCGVWVDHIKANGFEASVTDVPDMRSIRTRYKIPGNLTSCHTSVVGGYVVEGHVPASDIRRLLKEKPQGIVGLTIPGMPASAPGMDMQPFQPYEVLSFTADGKTAVFSKHTKAL